MLQFRRTDRSHWTREVALLFSLGSELGGDVSSHKVLVLNICRGEKRVKKGDGTESKAAKEAPKGTNGVLLLGDANRTG